MARNRIVPANELDPGPESAQPKQLGGASGLPDLPGMPVAAPSNLAGLPARKARRYRILNGGVVMYQNCRTAMRAGKEITDAQFDIELLRRQGIRLEPLDPPEQAAEPQIAAG